MRKIFIIFLFIPFISFSQNIGCTDTLALNFDPIADVDDGSCIYCDSLANFSTDTIITYDSLVQLNVLNITDATYTWNSSNLYNGQDVQTLLNYGYTPFEINNLLNQNPNFGSVDSLYNKDYRGGVIFYLDTLLGSGFVAAPNDEDSTTWGWVCIVGDTIGQMTSDSLYSGENNTNLILHGSGPACSQLGIAAELCYSSTQEGYDDWFLPSQDELTKLYNNLFFIDSLSFAQDFYWSSSEDQTTEALYFNAQGWNFITGTAQVMPKTHMHSVRAIKDFNNSASNFLTVFDPGWNSLTVNAFGCSSTDSIYVILDSIVAGCTDSFANNFDSLANFDDGSCLFLKTFVPDDNFEDYIETLGLGDGFLNDSVFTYRIDTVTILNLQNKNINYYDGLEGFSSLEHLNINYNYPLTHTGGGTNGFGLGVLDLRYNISLLSFFNCKSRLLELDPINPFFISFILLNLKLIKTSLGSFLSM